VVAWIDRLAPDICCFEEVWESPTSENTAAWLAANAAGEWHLAFGGAPFNGAGFDETVRFGCAVLSRWPIDRSERWALPLDERVDDFTTIVPWGLFHAATGGADVFVTHLASSPSEGHHRRLQVMAIDEHVRAIRGDRDAVPRGKRRAAPPPILCGDFNAEPESDEIRFLKGFATIDGRTTFWQDAWDVAGDGGSGLTQDWRTHPIAASLNVHRKRIDYVFVGDPFRREGDAGRVLSASVVCNEPLTGVQASDHMGVFVEISWS
jgi:endonuclease/exonuclease/phosphatase family metal-dependent hydrolase